MLRNIYESLDREIEEAFRDETSLGREAILYSTVMVDEERLGWIDLLGRRDWREIDAVALVHEGAALYVLSERGFRCYLPAFLRAALSENGTTYLLAEAIFTALAQRVGVNSERAPPSAAQLAAWRELGIHEAALDSLASRRSNPIGDASPPMAVLRPAQWRIALEILRMIERTEGLDTPEDGVEALAARVAPDLETADDPGAN